jgi:hypothetical protein
LLAAKHNDTAAEISYTTPQTIQLWIFSHVIVFYYLGGFPLGGGATRGRRGAVRSVVVTLYGAGAGWAIEIPIVHGIVITGFGLLPLLIRGELGAGVGRAEGIGGLGGLGEGGTDPGGLGV